MKPMPNFKILSTTEKRIREMSQQAWKGVRNIWGENLETGMENPDLQSKAIQRTMTMGPMKLIYIIKVLLNIMPVKIRPKFLMKIWMKALVKVQKTLEKDIAQAQKDQAITQKNIIQIQIGIMMIKKEMMEIMKEK